MIDKTQEMVIRDVIQQASKDGLDEFERVMACVHGLAEIAMTLGMEPVKDWSSLSSSLVIKERERVRKQHESLMENMQCS